MRNLQNALAQSRSHFAKALVSNLCPYGTAIVFDHFNKNLGIKDARVLAPEI